MHILPIFKGYTVDFRLQEFRKVSLAEPGNPDSREIEFIPFDSLLGEKLLRDYATKCHKQVHWRLDHRDDARDIRDA